MVVISFFCCFLGRDGRLLFSLGGNLDALSDGSAHPSDPRGESWQSDPGHKEDCLGNGVAAENTLARAGQPWVALDWTRPGKVGF